MVIQKGGIHSLVKALKFIEDKEIDIICLALKNICYNIPAFAYTDVFPAIKTLC